MTPTRTLFEPDQSGNGKSKRTFDVALLSPHKTKPPVKVPKTSMPAIYPEAKASTTAAPVCLSSPILSSSPQSHEISQPTFGRDAEIAESGDELDYSSSASSDSSFPDLDFLVPARTAVQQDTTDSDRGGRRKGGFSAKKGSTPNSRLRNKFDMKTLLDHQRRDDLMNSNFERLEAADLQAKKGEEAEPIRGVVTASPNTVRRQFVDVAGVREETAGKALRAMERTEAVNAIRNRWYFFKPCRHACTATEPPEFPKHAATGPWTLLAKDRARARHFENGTLKTLASRISVPDEAFLWVLHAIAKEKKYALRQSYYQFVSFADPEQVQRLVSPECLLEVFGSLGAAEDVNDEQLRPVQEEPGVYRGRDWSQLQTYLKWLSNVSSKLEPDALNTAVTSLLRMAVDTCLLDNPDILRDHQNALKRLVEAVDPASWDSFVSCACYDRTECWLSETTVRESLRVPLQRIRQRLPSFATSLLHGSGLRQPKRPKAKTGSGVLLRRLIARQRASRPWSRHPRHYRAPEARRLQGSPQGRLRGTQSTHATAGHRRRRRLILTTRRRRRRRCREGLQRQG